MIRTVSYKVVVLYYTVEHRFSILSSYDSVPTVLYITVRILEYEWTMNDESLQLSITLVRGWVTRSRLKCSRSVHFALIADFKNELDWCLLWVCGISSKQYDLGAFAQRTKGQNKKEPLKHYESHSNRNYIRDVNWNWHWKTTVLSIPRLGVAAYARFSYATDNYMQTLFDKIVDLR